MLPEAVISGAALYFLWKSAEAMSVPLAPGPQHIGFHPISTRQWQNAQSFRPNEYPSNQTLMIGDPSIVKGHPSDILESQTDTYNQDIAAGQRRLAEHGFKDIGIVPPNPVDYSVFNVSYYVHGGNQIQRKRNLAYGPVAATGGIRI